MAWQPAWVPRTLVPALGVLAVPRCALLLLQLLEHRQMSEAMQQSVANGQMPPSRVGDMNAVTMARSNIEQVDERDNAGTIGKTTLEEVVVHAEKNVNMGDGLLLQSLKLARQAPAHDVAQRTAWAGSRCSTARRPSNLHFRTR